MLTVQQTIRTTSLRECNDINLELAFLYSLRNSSDENYVSVLEGVIDQSEGMPLDEPNMLYCLHAATLLAQSGEFQGVEWMLKRSSSETERGQRLISKALVDCNRFPIAAIAGSVFKEPQILLDDPKFLQIAQRTDEELWDLNSESKDTQNSMLEMFREHLTARSEVLRESWNLELGMVLRRPALNEWGFRWTGFVGLESKPIGLPFTTSNVINLDDETATNNLSRFLGSEGRRVLVAWKTSQSPSAAYIYALPFGLMEKPAIEKRVATQSWSGKGVEVGVVIEWLKNRERYKVITSNGFSTASRYAVSKQKIGSCFFYHPDNSGRLLSSFFRLSKVQQAKFFEELLKRCPERFGAVVRTFKNKGDNMVHIVHANSGQEQTRPVNAVLERGALVLWEHNEEQARWYASVLEDFAVESSCKNCFATKRRICAKCDGTTLAVCGWV